VAHSLILNLTAPLQSWGYRSRFKDRDTGLEPTKSGIIGLLCCALGRDRKESVEDLVALKMAVRVDRQGKLITEYQTAGGGKYRDLKPYAARKSNGNGGKDPILLNKHYLQDASFTVALEGSLEQLEALQAALNDPFWPVFLGRKSCPPSEPIAKEIVEHEALEALKTYPIQSGERKVRFVVELARGQFNGESRQDIPVNWSSRQNRTYAIRYVLDQEHELIYTEEPQS
jgi:CRISPR system Cascade subunit CasD